MNDQTPPHQRRLPQADRGRAQDSSRDDLIISAALALLGEKGYQALTMTAVAARAGVSTATLYRRWRAKADLVADAVATLDPLTSPRYSGTSLRDDLLALMEHAGTCEDRPKTVTMMFAMARVHPDLYRTLADRFSTFVRAELGQLAGHAVAAGHVPLSAVELDVLGDTVIALLAHHAGPMGASVPRATLIRLVDHGLIVLMTGARAAP